MIYLENNFLDHEKMIAVGGEGVLVWLAGMQWLKERRSTDGRIPKVVALAKFEPRIRGKALPVAPIMARLIEVGSWHDDGDHVIVHGYVERNEASILRSQVAKTNADKRWAKERERRTKALPDTSEDDADGNALALQPQCNGSASSSATSNAYSPQSTVHSPQEVLVSGSLGATPEASPASDEGFDAFWQGYPRRNGKRVGKTDAAKVWKRMSRPERAAALLGVEHYREACEAQLGPLAQDAHRWLTHKRWEDWQTPAVVTPRVNGSRSAVLARPGKLPLVESMARMAAGNGQHQLPEVTG